MQSLTRLTLFLCCAWAASLFYGEMVAYRIPLWACSWPQPYSSSPSGRRMDRKSNASDQINVAVLADPQLMDRTSLRLPPRSLALEAAQFYTDLYMRRSFIASILPFRPDLILFLGDQFDGGPFLSDLEWQGSLNRFKHIFELSDDGRISGIQVYYLSGNHDIGYSRFHSLYPEVVNRFEKEFGVRNYHFNIQNVEFVAVDAQTLDGPIQGNLTSLSWDFIKNMSKDVTLNPRVLLTHIPLHRPDGTPCGPSRSSDIINQRVSRAGPDKGIIYQNYLSEETSRQLLKLIRPVLVLSGHDHDQCTVTHTTSDGTVIEHTLGTLSWQQGNLYPSFMLLSVASLESSSSSNRGLVSTHLCFLPMQTHIYIWYLALFVATLLLLIFWPTNGFGSWNHCWHWMSYNGGTRRGNYTVASKEKDEDEHCDYEMVWDAEGSMHLVKRASVKISVTTSNDTGLMGRGGVVARPTVKKNSTPEIEAAIEMTTDVKFDDTGKGLKFSKLKARKILQRLIRVIRLLVIIASVNVPLYMMLLFKDSIEER